ncbi:Cardioacceleratory peptide receptor [Gryllus bimaculatus]|nr:Cardioacceleratory peptide receptor [Gryllus bimaculatus]
MEFPSYSKCDVERVQGTPKQGHPRAEQWERQLPSQLSARAKGRRKLHKVAAGERRALRQDDQDSRRASSRGLIPRAKIKTVKMTFVIVFVFILCWSPYFVFDLLQVYGHVPSTQTNIAVATFIQSLAPLNSAANPLIYCLFSTHICRTLRKIPPFSWVAAGLSLCFPALRSGDGRCLRYATGDSSSTVTETLTQQSSRRSTSLRHTMQVRPANAERTPACLAASTTTVSLLPTVSPIAAQPQHNPQHNP